MFAAAPRETRRPRPSPRLEIMCATTAWHELCGRPPPALAAAASEQLLEHLRPRLHELVATALRGGWDVAGCGFVIKRLHAVTPGVGPGTLGSGVRGQDSADSTNFGRLRQSWPEFDHIQAMPTDVGTCAMFRPNSTKLERAMSTKFGTVSAKFGLDSTWARTRPTRHPGVPDWANTARCSAELGPASAKLGPMSAKLGRADRFWTAYCQVELRSDRT